jgi:hypothetical protein
MQPEDVLAIVQQLIEVASKQYKGGLDYEDRERSELMTMLLVQWTPAEVPRRAMCLTETLASLSSPATFLASPAFLAEVPGLPSGRFSEQQLVDFLKMPLCQDPARQAIVHQLGRQCGRDFAELWDAVEWLRLHRPDIGLAAPPRRL